MALPTHDLIPLAADPQGVVRVAGTRVTLDMVIHAFQNGATAEEIVQRYPVLALGDVYAVIGYYLRHQDEVNVYLQTAAEQSAEVRAMNETRHDPMGIRARLLARKQA